MGQPGLSSQCPDLLNISAVLVQYQILRIEMDVAYAFALFVQILPDKQYRHILVVDALGKQFGTSVIVGYSLSLISKVALFESKKSC